MNKNIKFLVCKLLDTKKLFKKVQIACNSNYVSGIITCTLTPMKTFISYLDCHGVITPSSGPPMRTTFLRRKKFCRNSKKGRKYIEV